MYKYLFLFICFTSFSQKGNLVKGRLIDSLHAEPLSFASVQIESKNQTSLKGQIANEKGMFEFADLKEDDYILKIQYVGYQTKLVKFSITQSNSSLNLGSISILANNQLLESVLVSAEKSKVISTLEKQVFKAD